MKAVRIDRTGGPEVIALAVVTLPAPGPREVRVRHVAVGVNFIDIYHRTGLYPLPLPSGLGMEAAGIVESVGAEVTRFAIGQRVAYASGLGAYAEAANVAEDRLVRVPDAIALEIAAAIMLKGMTAEYLLRRTYRVGPGDVILFHAAAGGVGQIACQWARHLGATVIGTVGSEEKIPLAKANGCHHVIHSRRENIAQRVRELTAGAGVAVVYDSVGKDTWEASLDCLRPRGLMVSFGNASGPVPPFAPGTLAQKGSLYLTRPTLMHYTASVQDLEHSATELFAAVASAAVRIPTPGSYRLTQAAEAHRALESRATTGAMILTPDG